MSLHKEKDENSSFPEVHFHETPEELHHRRDVRKQLDAYLERKRLKRELEDEINGEFDWDDFE